MDNRIIPRPQFLEEAQSIAFPTHFQRELYALIRQERPQIFVETGVAMAVSTYFILSAMDKNKLGRLWSIDPMTEAMPGPPIVTQHPRWTLIKQRSEDCLLKVFEKIGMADMFLHDSDHGYGCQLFEYEMAWRFVRPGGFIITDDSQWAQHGAWREFLERHGLTEYELGYARLAHRP